MHAYLVIGEDEKEKRNLFREIAKRENAKDIMTFGVEKIEDARELLSFVKLSVSKKTAIFIENIDRASVEAQNSLLKTLEEPQKNLIFVLMAQNEERVLATIVSRCNLVFAKKDNTSDENASQSFSEFYRKSVSEKFEFVKEVKKREDAEEFLTNLIRGGHTQFVKKGSDNANFLEEAVKTLNAIKSNGNIGLQLTRFIVAIS